MGGRYSNHSTRMPLDMSSPQRGLQRGLLIDILTNTLGGFQSGRQRDPLEDMQALAGLSIPSGTTGAQAVAGVHIGCQQPP